MLSTEKDSRKNKEERGEELRRTESERREILVES
jgi:hypothetical protein